MKNFGKLSLEDFKKEFSSKEKEALMDELTGGILGACHCGVSFSFNTTCSNPPCTGAGSTVTSHY